MGCDSLELPILYCENNIDYLAIVSFIEFIPSCALGVEYMEWRDVLIVQ